MENSSSRLIALHVEAPVASYGELCLFERIARENISFGKILIGSGLRNLKLQHFAFRRHGSRHVR